MIHDAHFFAAVRPRRHRSAIRNAKLGTLLRGRWPVATPSLPRIGIPTPVDIGLANLYPYSATIAAAHFTCGCVATLVNRACCGWRLRRLDWTCRDHALDTQSSVMGSFTSQINLWPDRWCEVCR